MRSIRVLSFILALSMIWLGGCSKEPPTPEEPTQSSEDVIRTAEAIAEQTRKAATSTPSPTPITPTPTVIPETDTPEPTPTPSKPVVRADYNANVRSGPDESYAVIDFFLQGQEADVIGQYQNPRMGVWWYIKRIGEGLSGWVWGGAVTLSGDASNIPYLQPPPTSTPTKPPTSPPAATDTPSPTETSPGG
jgi:hypothetical protein